MIISFRRTGPNGLIWIHINAPKLNVTILTVIQRRLLIMSVAHGPKDQLCASFLKLFKPLKGFWHLVADVWKLVLYQGTVKINGDDFRFAHFLDISIKR